MPVCNKSNLTCYQKADKKVVKFGPTKTVHHTTKKVPKRKFVSYGVDKNVICGKFTQQDNLGECPQCCK